MGRLINDFKRDMRTNNAKFRRDMKANNLQFRESLKTAQQKATQSQLTDKGVKKPAEAPKVSPNAEKPKRKKRIIIAIVTACLVLFVVLSVVFAPPTLSVTSSTDPQTEGAYTVSGKITSGDTVTVNGKTAQITGDTFTAKLDLVEGDNDIKVIAYRGNKKTEKIIKVHRFTSVEIAEQKRVAAEKQAQLEVQKKAVEEKKRAEAAEQEKQKQEALTAEKKRQDEAAAKVKADQEAASSSQNGDGYVNSSGSYVPSPSNNPNGASAKCRDGTYSYSQTRRGTCSHHGGVAEWL